MNKSKLYILSLIIFFSQMLIAQEVIFSKKMEFISVDSLLDVDVSFSGIVNCTAPKRSIQGGGEKQINVFVVGSESQHLDVTFKWYPFLSDDFTDRNVIIAQYFNGYRYLSKKNIIQKNISIDDNQIEIRAISIARAKPQSIGARYFLFQKAGLLEADYYVTSEKSQKEILSNINKFMDSIEIKVNAYEGYKGFFHFGELFSEERNSF